MTDDYAGAHAPAVVDGGVVPEDCEHDWQTLWNAGRQLNRLDYEAVDVGRWCWKCGKQERTR